MYFLVDSCINTQSLQYRFEWKLKLLSWTPCNESVTCQFIFFAPYTFKLKISPMSASADFSIEYANGNGISIDYANANDISIDYENGDDMSQRELFTYALKMITHKYPHKRCCVCIELIQSSSYFTPFVNVSVTKFIALFQIMPRSGTL